MKLKTSTKLEWCSHTSSEETYMSFLSTEECEHAVYLVTQALNDKACRRGWLDTEYDLKTRVELVVEATGIQYFKITAIAVEA